MHNNTDKKLPNYQHTFYKDFMRICSDKKGNNLELCKKYDTNSIITSATQYTTTPSRYLFSHRFRLMADLFEVHYYYLFYFLFYIFVLNIIGGEIDRLGNALTLFTYMQLLCLVKSISRKFELCK